ncbi:MAG: hypothetical protein IJ576_01240, partial [Synergistaceae bacterium]|nr:hypothetical protein [Synergistaceae bacterium]
YSLLKNLNFLENLDVDNLTAEDLENFQDIKNFKDFKAENANTNEAEAKDNKKVEDEDAAEQARAKNFAAKIDAILTRYENEIENFIANQNQEAEQAQVQELKDNIIFRLNSQSSAVRNIAIKRIGSLINRDDVRQTLINLILNHGIDSESSRFIEALPMDNDTRERIASSVCEKSAAFPSSLIIKLLDLRNLNNFNFNLIERYILCASPENLALILRYWPKDKILSDTTLNNLLRSDDANILVPLLSVIKQNFPQEASKHAKRISELKDHSSPAVRAWARMLKQD